MHIEAATNEQEWESFLLSQPWSPFLQSWSMGEVYRKIGEEPIRLEVRAQGDIVGICQAIIVPAKRGKHLAVLYGPVITECENAKMRKCVGIFVDRLKEIAREKDCTFIRLSPFWPMSTTVDAFDFRPSPLHLLAEHIWYLPLQGKTEEEIRKGMRSTTRNLIGRAEREGVNIELSSDPMHDLPHFLRLHDETRKRHGFTPYTDDFFRAQVSVFAPKKQCGLYLARFNGEVIAASIHMFYGKETSYHHGASSGAHAKIPASYALQWRAIQDAIRRGDRLYNFWGIAPIELQATSYKLQAQKHPFSGVTTFKTGFGGELFELVHCMDIPLTKKYFLTWGVETLRKWRRGF